MPGEFMPEMKHNLYFSKAGVSLFSKLYYKAGKWVKDNNMLTIAQSYSSFMCLPPDHLINISKLNIGYFQL